MDLEKCQLHIINYFVKTKIEKNVPFLHEHIRYCSIYIFTGHIICDEGKVEIICAIRGDSQLKINVLHDIIPVHVFKIKRHC